jgi:sugar phosphate isomerase/epimerase
MAFALALQLYTVRDAVSNRFLDGLADVADIGYRFVEFAGFGNANAELAGRRITELGIKASGAHVPLSILDDPLPVIAELQAIGCSEATLPWVPPDFREDWQSTAARLEDCAEKLAEHGIAFGYHNHDFEFKDNGFQTLTNCTKSTNFQLDVYWAEKAGESSVEWINLLHGRLPSIHCKDLGSDGSDIEVGEGTLDWQTIVSAAESAGVSTLVAEMDTPRHEPLESARRCLEGLKKVTSLA